MHLDRRTLIAGFLLAGPALASVSRPVVSGLKITLLSTGLAGGPRAGLGEWGFSALVEADGRCLLYDTGAQPDLVLRNAASLGVDLSTADEVILSHFHPDHVGGLLTLRTALAPAHPAALSRAEVARGIFEPRYHGGERDLNPMTVIRPAYERAGGTFHTHDQPTELAPGVWFTGPIPRVTAEQNTQAGIWIGSPGARSPDVVAEDSALVISTAQGAVVLTGCGHAGLVNILKVSDQITGGRSLLAVIGGVHLAEAPERVVDWTASELRRRRVRYLLLGHCSGVGATARLRRDLGLAAADAGIGAVGSTFTLGKGIGQPLSAL